MCHAPFVLCHLFARFFSWIQRPGSLSAKRERGVYVSSYITYTPRSLFAPLRLSQADAHRQGLVLKGEELSCIT